MKRTLTFLLVLVLCFSLIAEVGASASAASVTYYPKYTGSSGSIVDGLRAVGADSSYSSRAKIAALNGISSYSGTAAQNTQMLNLLKQGKLIKSRTSGSAPAPAPTPAPTPKPAAGSLITNKSYDVSVSNRARENRPHYECPVTARSAANYNTVIDQFNVKGNSRYKRTSDATWCNIFAWDVMTAMQVKLPHWVSKSGVPVTSFTNGAHELTANATYNWLNDHGTEYGWKKVTAAQAQSAANAGKPTIAIWKNPRGASGHVAVVRPETASFSLAKGGCPVIAQAGATNYSITYVSTGFGSSRLSAVVYWTHA